MLLVQESLHVEAQNWALSTCAAPAVLLSASGARVARRLQVCLPPALAVHRAVPASTVSGEVMPAAVMNKWNVYCGSSTTEVYSFIT